LTYNVHRCLGVDGVLSPRRIAGVIAACRPDIVALQELDVGRARTGRVDQAHAIAHALDMELHFHSVLQIVEEQYGDAILTTRPSRLVRAAMLPGRSRIRRLAPRGALWVSIDVGGARLQVINTHLGLTRRERRLQVDALLGPGWLGHPDCADPVILLGDFNAVPPGPSYRRLSGRLADAQRAPGIARARPTFPSRLPVLRLDHVFASRSIVVHRVEVLRSKLARLASDHLPLVVDFAIAPAALDAAPSLRLGVPAPTAAPG
jgi:endonuclease/exonuclease/phosphatase family metal-dependent hydrolase